LHLLHYCLIDAAYRDFVSSMDVVHARYDKCPHDQLANYKGKEGHPTIGCQAHVGHNKIIYYLGPGFPSARNNKTVVMCDQLMHMMKSDLRYAEFEYDMYVENGERNTMIECDCLALYHLTNKVVSNVDMLHNLCDGGYHMYVVNNDMWLQASRGLQHESMEQALREHEEERRVCIWHREEELSNTNVPLS